MQLASLFRRTAAAVPVRHIFLALCIAVSVGVGFWYRSSKLPVDYVSSALLSYEEPQHLQTDSRTKDADSPIVRIAESVLSPPVLLKVADRVRFPSDGPGGPYGTAASAADVGANPRSEAFRSHFSLTEPAPGLLQVTFRGADAGLVTGSTNAIAAVLAAWVAQPAHSPSPSVSGAAKPIAAPQAPLHVSPAPPPAVQIRPDASARKPEAEILLHRAAGLEENIATLALQQRNIERDIADLLKERDGVSSGPAADHARRAAINSQLGELRSLRETLIEQRETQSEQVQSLKAQAAALRTSVTAPAAADPTSSPTPPVAITSSHDHAPSPPVNVQRADATSTQQAWGGNFTVIDRAHPARPVGDDRKALLWAGLGVAFASAVFYLALAAWRFRPISDPNTLRRVLSGNAKYFGAVAGNPITEKSS